MSGQPTTTATPQTHWGNNTFRVRPGGDLGNREYWYRTEVSTGNISVYRHTKAPGFPLGDGGSVDTKIGTIRPGGTFEIESRSDGTPYTTTAETLHWAQSRNVNASILAAESVATQQWDQRTQPSPHNSIRRDWVPAPDPTETDPNIRNNPENPVFEPGNTATTSSPTQSPLARALTNASPEQRGRMNDSLGRGQFAIYPETMRQTGGDPQDHIKIQTMRYKPKGVGDFSGGDLSGGGSRKKNREMGGYVILPIPGGISDNNSVSWGADNMDPVSQAVASLAYSGIMQGFEGMGSKAKEILNAVRDSSKVAGEAMGVAIAAAASKQGAQLLQRTKGAIINPNMELLFNNPAIRQFNFTWKLAPRDPGEARQVTKIIRFFKQGMAPIREHPNLFLKSPNTFKLTYNCKGVEHKYLNKFKECALLNCGVQYTPDGNYATFDDGVMTAYQLTLSFQELEPVYSDDYEQIRDNTTIGY